jgi:hypothetical protein
MAPSLGSSQDELTREWNSAAQQNWTIHSVTSLSDKTQLRRHKVFTRLRTGAVVGNGIVATSNLTHDDASELAIEEPRSAKEKATNPYDGTNRSIVLQVGS